MKFLGTCNKIKTINNNNKTIKTNKKKKNKKHTKTTIKIRRNESNETNHNEKQIKIKQQYEVILYVKTIKKENKWHK